MNAKLKATLLASLALGGLLAQGSMPAKADDVAAEIAALKAEIRALERKVAAQERKQAATQKAVAAVAAQGPPVYAKGPPPIMTTACPPGAFSIKGICITPGGFVDLTGIYRSRNLESDEATVWNSIPFANNKVSHTSEERFSARASRFSLLIQGKVDPVTTLSGYGEIDFQGAAQTANSNQTNSYQPRLRQAYLEMDRSDFGFHVIAGQTWSLNTMTKEGLLPSKVLTPITIDQQYVPGFTYARQPQIRLVKDFGSFWLAASAENPATTFAGTVPAGVVATSLNGCGGSPAVNPAGDTYYNACNTLSLNHIPDVTGKVAFDPMLAGHAVHLEGWGMVRDFYDRTESAAIFPGSPFATGNHDVLGAGFGGGLVAQVIPKLIDIEASGSTGDIGRYGASGLPDATFDSLTGKLAPINQTQLLAGIVVHATPALDVYGYGGEEYTNKRFTPGTLSGFGWGNPFSINGGCFIEGSTACVGNTKRIWQLTGGLWYTLYQGDYGKLQWGAQYSYTDKTSFGGALASGTPQTIANTIAPGAITAKANENVFMSSLRYFPF